MNERTCKMKHYCERDAFTRNRGYGKESHLYQHKYEVWDVNAGSRPDWDDPDCTEECVFQTDDKSLAEAFIAQGAQRCELRENGVCEVCDLYERRQADLKSGKVRPFFLVVEGTSRHYGGPEEGGWWYDWHEVLEVRRAFTLEEGLRQMRTLREEYPQPRYNRYSCANRGEPDTRIVLCYGVKDPRWPSESTQRPRYE